MAWTSAPKILYLFDCLPDLLLEFSYRGARVLLQAFQTHRQQCHSLIDVVVKLSCDSSAFFLVRFDQLLTDPGKGLFHLFATRNVLSENENPSGQAVRAVPPRANLPAKPRGAAFSVPWVFVGSDGFARKSTAVQLLSSGRVCQEKCRNATSQLLGAVDAVVRTPAIAHLDVAHVTVEHCHSGRHVFNEYLE